MCQNWKQSETLSEQKIIVKTPMISV
jgi:hypothetical protein